MSSLFRVLHAETWNYFIFYLPGHFSRSQKIVKEAIMTDVNGLVQEFWRTSIDGADGESIIAMRRLLKILHVCFDNNSIFATVTAVDLADKNFRC
jgi:hypothetical protein